MHTQHGQLELQHGEAFNGRNCLSGHRLLQAHADHKTNRHFIHGAEPHAPSEIIVRHMGRRQTWMAPSCGYEGPYPIQIGSPLQGWSDGGEAFRSTTWGPGRGAWHPESTALHLACNEKLRAKPYPDLLVSGTGERLWKTRPVVAESGSIKRPPTQRE